jgi:hypothetical protein
MSEPAPVWCITPEDAAQAEQAEHADKLTELQLWAQRFADVLGTIHAAMSAQLPERLASDVTLTYATIMLQGGHGVYEDGCEDDA